LFATGYTFVFTQGIIKDTEMSRQQILDDIAARHAADIAELDEMNEFVLMIQEQGKWLDHIAWNVDNAAPCMEQENILEEEKIPSYIQVAMRMMYASKEGRFVVDHMKITKVLKSMSEKQGKKYSQPQSKKEIDPFVAFHGLDINEMLDPMSSFRNFNEFFFRKLKASARPIAKPADPKVVVSPADCRLMVFPTLAAATNLWIKGEHFNLKNLIQDEKLEGQFDGGSLAICRLAPQDYHRFHLPAACTVESFKPFEGAYYTVNPIAIRTPVDVYTENKRNCVLLSSPILGDFLYIAVGATMVGSILFTASQGKSYKKGDELGYFAFGGSTVLLLFQKGKVQFDEDLLANSEKPLETLIKMGDSLGKAL